MGLMIFVATMVVSIVLAAGYFAIDRYVLRRRLETSARRREQIESEIDGLRDGGLQVRAYRPPET